MVLHHQCGPTMTKKGKLNSVQAGTFEGRKKITLYNIVMTSKVGDTAQACLCILKTDY